MRKVRMAVAYIFLFAVLGGALGLFTPPLTAQAFTLLPPEAAEFNDGSLGIKVKNIINTALSILGGLSIIMVVVGGIRLTAAHGDPSQVKAGRETVLYALIGVVVAIAAGAIVNFVVSFNW